MQYDISQTVKKMEKKLQDLRGFLDLETKKSSLLDIQKQMETPGFWDDQEKSTKIMSEMKFLKGCIEPFDSGIDKLSDLNELAELAEDDEEMIEQIILDLAGLEKEVDALELKSLLSGQFDKCNAILSLNAGAGGTESCDWASMLLRMYMRWGELNDCKVQALDIQYGDEAGVKSATLNIEGALAYGYLKAEKGVHRLVRISPFDSNKRRHTSFVSVDVLPEIDDEIEIEVNTEDVRIDIFRASGPGGQCVNTTDSAVRMTHIPTGIVVQCQNERSQLQNRIACMKVLKARLYEKKLKEQEDELAKEYGQKQKIEWGSQIRSYVMHPYSMVKDHRTDTETGNVPKVMDGDIAMFIEAFLKWKPE